MVAVLVKLMAVNSEFRLAREEASSPLLIIHDHQNYQIMFCLLGLISDLRLHLVMALSYPILTPKDRLPVED
jgi:hypothetical protein